MRCGQNRARLVRAHYERLDRLDAALTQAREQRPAAGSGTVMGPSVRPTVTGARFWTGRVRSDREFEQAI